MFGGDSWRKGGCCYIDKRRGDCGCAFAVAFVRVCLTAYGNSGLVATLCMNQTQFNY